MNKCVVCGEVLTPRHQCSEARLKRIEAGHKAAQTVEERGGRQPTEAERLEYGLSLLDFQE